MYILLLECIICTAIYTLITVRELIKQREFSGFFVAIAMYDLVFGIFPTVVVSELLWDGQDSRFLQSLIDVSDSGIDALIYYYLLALIGFIVLFLSYHGKICLTTRKGSNSSTLRGGNNEEPHFGRFILTAWGCLLVGIISLYLWSNAYGSIFNLILEANAVRSGMGSVVNGLAFFKHSARLVLLCSFLFISLCFKSQGILKKGFYKFVNFMGLIVSVIASTLFLLADDGRLSIVLFLLAAFWLLLAGKTFEHIGKVIIGGMAIVFFSLFLLNEMDSITHFIRMGEWVEPENLLISSMIHELSFLPVGGQVSVLASWNNEVHLTLFDDLVTGLFAWFPYSLKPSGFEDVWNINTILIWGNMSVSHGQWPCSFITQANYDLRFFGVLIYSLIAGRILKGIDKWQLDDNSLFKIAIKASFIEFIVRGVAYFSFYDIMLGLFPIVIAIMIKYGIDILLSVRQ